jgi:spermidine synthase
MPGRYPVSGGTAELLQDADRDQGWLLSVDGVPQSYVDLSEPAYLDFEYMRLMAEVVDRLTPRGAAIDAVHVGGAACTLPRYIAATRPGSRQVVFEPDAGLVTVVREQLALDTVPGLDVRITGGRGGVAALPGDTADLVVVDAYCGATMPIELATQEFTREVARVLRPGGVHLVNVSDGPPLDFTRRMVATVSGVFPNVMLLVPPEVLNGHGFGNLVLAAAPAPLPPAGRARTAGEARHLRGAGLARFCSGAAPLRDGEEATPPDPPPEVFGQG